MKIFMTLSFSREKLEAFALQNYNQVQLYEDTTDDHEKLLREYMIDMHIRIGDLLRKVQQKFKIPLSNAEAMAFYQVWQKVDLRHCPYSRVIVGDAIAQIDKFHKSPVTKDRYARVRIV